MTAFTLACPFCLDPLCEIETTEDSSGNVLSVQVVCDECGAKGPETPSEQHAIEAWNRPVRAMLVSPHELQQGNEK